MTARRKIGRKIVVWSIGIVALGGAVAVQNIEFKHQPGRGRGRHIAAAMPVAGVELPLGQTEVGVRSVWNTLRCDDVFYREYRFSGGALRVYVAYWAPNKIATQLVASHTPDWCWSATGWTCAEMRFGEVPHLGVKVLPAEWRVFCPPDGSQPRQYVLYWHLVGGRLYDYGKSFNFLLNPFKWWRDFILYTAVGNGEQYFIRLSSDVPIESLASNPAFRTVIEDLANLGLRAAPEKN